MIEALAPARLVRRADLSRVDFQSTGQIQPGDTMIGQQRALDALRFGSSIAAPGFNLFVIGPREAGLDRSVHALLADKAAAMPTPGDWAYLHNFADPRAPRVLRLPAGRAPQLHKAIDDLIADLEVALPAAFESEDYGARRRSLNEAFAKRQEEAFEALAKEAAASETAIVRTPVGFGVAPIADGEVLKPDMFQALPEQERRQRQEAMEGIERKLEDLLATIPKWDKQRRDDIRKLDRDTARAAVVHSIEETRNAVRDLPQAITHLDELEKHLLDNAGAFIAVAAEEDDERKTAMRQLGNFGLLGVNVLVTSAGRPAGAPVVEELHPTLGNLVGRVEHVWEQGVLSTDFRRIKAGALHRAAGGFLVLDARSLLTEPFSYLALKRALKTGKVRFESVDEMIGLLSTQSLEPEPIPLDVKVVLIGDRYLYYLLASLDPELTAHFKVLADFDDGLEWTESSEAAFLQLIASVQQREALLPLDRGAAERVIEHAARIAADEAKLSLQLERIRDLMVEADFWSRREGGAVTTRASVERAIAEHIGRSNRVRDRMMEATLKDVLLIATDGKRVGQVNGLSVISLGDYTFGRPTRISARVRPGTGKVIDIEREVELGGPIHSKGVLILSGYLAGKFALDTAYALQASLVFEQSYSGVEGDSASSAELYALLSALAEVPLRQDLAITGSVNQFGEVQAIGGVNEKIEGFFDLCRERGLTGTQGVLIPAANVRHLMLRADVVAACSEGRFAVYPVGNIDQGIELLSGMRAAERDEKGEFPSESFHARVEARLRGFARVRQIAEAQAAEAAEKGAGRRGA